MLQEAKIVTILVTIKIQFKNLISLLQTEIAPGVLIVTCQALILEKCLCQAMMVEHIRLQVT